MVARHAKIHLKPFSLLPRDMGSEMAVDEKWVEALRRAAGGATRAWDLLRSLTDEVGPRFSGTPGEAAAVEWAVAAMQHAGLSNVRREATPTVLWERGDDRVELVSPRREPLVAAALGGSVPTVGRLDAQLVEVSSLEEIDRLGRAKLEGKLVYLHHVMPRLRDGTGYNQGGWARTAGPARAARHGAAGFLIRSIATHSMRVAHTGSLAYERDVPQIPAAALSPPDGDLLHRLLGAGQSVRIGLDLRSRPLLAGESHNVIGEIPGTDLADQIVLFGAHLDSWDVGRGAVDDGAGCVIALELARLLGGLPERPRRTVRVALFANEELGAAGGRTYASAHAGEAGKHVVALEADQGDGKPWALRVPEGKRESAAAKRLHAALSALGVALDQGPARGGVDIGPMHGHGVPFVDLRQDATRYFDLQHSANDVLENVARDELEAAVAVFTVTVGMLASMDETFR